MPSLKKSFIPCATVIGLLKYLSVNVYPNLAGTKWEKHPDYPGLLSISYTLNVLQIENKSFRVDFEGLLSIDASSLPYSKRHEIPDEFIIHKTNLRTCFAIIAGNKGDDTKTPVSQRLLVLNKSIDNTIIATDLHGRFEQKQKDYNGWARVYPVKLKGADYTKRDKQKIGVRQRK